MQKERQAEMARMQKQCSKGKEHTASLHCIFYMGAAAVCLLVMLGVVQLPAAIGATGGCQTHRDVAADMKMMQDSRAREQ